MMPAAPRWEVPEAVEPPSTEALRRALVRLRQASALRTGGWITLLGSVLCLGIGHAAGWAEFTVIGVLGVVMVSIALATTIGRADLEVDVAIPAASVSVGDPAAGAIRVRNRSTRRHLGSRVDLPVGDAVAGFGARSLRGGQEFTERFTIPTTRRGVVRIGPAASILGDPFALAGRERRWSDEQLLHVHPNVVALPAGSAGFVHDLEGQSSAHLASDDLDFHALRPYVSGDDIRHVHWRSSARTGGLLVRQFEESRRARVAVALDTCTASYLSDPEFELAVSCAASVTVQSIDAGAPPVLLTPGTALNAGSRGAALDALAEVSPTARGGIHALAKATLRREPAASLAIGVTGSSATLPALLAAGAAFDVATRVILVRVDLGARVWARTVGAISVLRVGALSDLPVAIRGAQR